MWHRVLIGLLLLVPGPVFGQEASTKIGVIDIQGAITESALGRQAAIELETHGDALATGLEETRNQLAEAQERLLTQQLALSPTALNELNRTIEELTTKLQRDTDDANREMQIRQDELFQPVGALVLQVLDGYMQEQEYSVILEAGTVVLFDEISDVTTEIIRRMDAVEVAPVDPEARIFGSRLRQRGEMEMQVSHKYVQSGWRQPSD